MCQWRLLAGSPSSLTPQATNRREGGAPTEAEALTINSERARGPGSQMRSHMRPQPAGLGLKDICQRPVSLPGQSLYGIIMSGTGGSGHDFHSFEISPYWDSRFVQVAVGYSTELCQAAVLSKPCCSWTLKPTSPVFVEDDNYFWNIHGILGLPPQIQHHNWHPYTVRKRAISLAV
jgi:hypothetical protein